VTGLRDSAIQRLRRVGGWPEFTTDRYDVIDEIGRGGMGTVYRALDRELGREVAIKIPNGTGESASERRLHSEARILASLEHPGIVPIHDSGRLADGRMYCVMKRVRGQTLREALDAITDPGERLRIFERLCEPVAFAHDAGVIHRDLKPDNVMIGSFGEVMVMDWGVAKQRDDTSSAAAAPAVSMPPGTESGAVIGTPGFMPPEHARGETAQADVRADVYSLGAILYLLLTDEDPALQADPALAVIARPDIPKPLRSMCAHALHPEPSGRYTTVMDFAEDVARYRAGQAILAHRETVVENALRLARTYRTAILLVLGYIVMRAAVALTAGW
jgi:eukaryotic-like serine/threonine-protein kinase